MAAGSKPPLTIRLDVGQRQRQSAQPKALNEHKEETVAAVVFRVSLAKLKL